MLDRESLKALLQESELNQSDKTLLCLATRDPAPLQVREIRQVAMEAGLRAVEKWNVSAALQRSGGYAVRTGSGWELTSSGRKKVSELASDVSVAPAPKLAATLRDQLSDIPDSQSRAFVEEAVRCFEYRLFRAAVVFSWLGAVAVLQDHVIEKDLRAFNQEASRRNSSWKSAKNRDDLAEMKEWNFLQILRAISVIGKSTKQELENCLQRRNGCGHPNNFRIGEKLAAAHLETLIDNVFSKF